MRRNLEDVILPLSTPIKGRNGILMNAIELSKNTTIILPLLNVNLSTGVWGADADEFKPDRHVDKAIDTKVPGIYGNILTFGGGNRACIGYRFAVAEIKATIFTLVRSIVFEDIPTQPEIARMGGLGISRPRAVGATEPGLKVIMRPYVS